MRRVLLLVLTLVLGMIFSSCTIDLEDGTNDDNYVRVYYYQEIDEETDEISLVYYVNNLTFYEFDKDELENVFAIHELSYGPRCDWTVDFKEYFDVYAVKEKRWESIPEIAWFESDQKLSDDVLSLYGTLPILSSSYNIGDVVRITYIEYGLSLHFMVERTDNYLYVRYGDLRKMVIL